jgi:hypothetical protein
MNLGGEKKTCRMERTIIVPIHKRGDRDKRENYRGIALRNAAYRILSNIILEKLNHILKKLYERLSEWMQRRKICN